MENGEWRITKLKSYENRKTNPLDLAAQVYEGLSESQIEEIERIALDRSDFFGERIQ